MKRQHNQRTAITIETAVRRTGLSRYEVLRYVGRGVVRQPLSDRDVAELRRIRRLQELGVNLVGVEIILRMRRRISALEAELSRREQTSVPAAMATGRWRRLLSWEPNDECF